MIYQQPQPVQVRFSPAFCCDTPQPLVRHAFGYRCGQTLGRGDGKPTTTSVAGASSSPYASPVTRCRHDSGESCPVHGGSAQSVRGTDPDESGLPTNLHPGSKPSILRCTADGDICCIHWSTNELVFQAGRSRFRYRFKKCFIQSTWNQDARKSGLASSLGLRSLAQREVEPSRIRLAVVVAMGVSSRTSYTVVAETEVELQVLARLGAALAQTAADRAESAVISPITRSESTEGRFADSNVLLRAALGPSSTPLQLWAFAMADARRDGAGLPIPRPPEALLREATAMRVLFSSGAMFERDVRGVGEQPRSRSQSRPARSPSRHLSESLAAATRVHKSSKRDDAYNRLCRLLGELWNSCSLLSVASNSDASESRSAVYPVDSAGAIFGDAALIAEEPIFPVQLFLVRHGQQQGINGSASSLAGVELHATLSRLGRQQMCGATDFIAHVTGGFFKSRTLAVWSSDLPRSVEAARIVIDGVDSLRRRQLAALRCRSNRSLMEPEDPSDTTTRLLERCRLVQHPELREINPLQASGSDFKLVASLSPAIADELRQELDRDSRSAGEAVWMISSALQGLKGPLAPTILEQPLGHWTGGHAVFRHTDLCGGPINLLASDQSIALRYRLPSLSEPKDWTCGGCYCGVTPSSMQPFEREGSANFIFSSHSNLLKHVFIHMMGFPSQFWKAVEIPHSAVIPVGLHCSGRVGCILADAGYLLGYPSTKNEDPKLERLAMTFTANILAPCEIESSTAVDKPAAEIPIHSKAAISFKSHLSTDKLPGPLSGPCPDNEDSTVTTPELGELGGHPQLLYSNYDTARNSDVSTRPRQLVDPSILEGIQDNLSNGRRYVVLLRSGHSSMVVNPDSPGASIARSETLTELGHQQVLRASHWLGTLLTTCPLVTRPSIWNIGGLDSAWVTSRSSISQSVAICQEVLISYLSDASIEPSLIRSSRSLFPENLFSPPQTKEVVEAIVVVGDDYHLLKYFSAAFRIEPSILLQAFWPHAGYLLVSIDSMGRATLPLFGTISFLHPLEITCLPALADVLEPWISSQATPQPLDQVPAATEAQLLEPKEVLSGANESEVAQPAPVNGAAAKTLTLDIMATNPSSRRGSTTSGRDDDTPRAQELDSASYSSEIPDAIVGKRPDRSDFEFLKSSDEDQVQPSTILPCGLGDGPVSQRGFVEPMWPAEGNGDQRPPRAAWRSWGRGRDSSGAARGPMEGLYDRSDNSNGAAVGAWRSRPGSGPFQSADTGEAWSVEPAASRTLTSAQGSRRQAFHNGSWLAKDPAPVDVDSSDGGAAARESTLQDPPRSIGTLAAGEGSITRHELRSKVLLSGRAGAETWLPSRDERLASGSPYNTDISHWDGETPRDVVERDTSGDHYEGHPPSPLSPVIGTSIASPFSGPSGDTAVVEGNKNSSGFQSSAVSSMVTPIGQRHVLVEQEKLCGPTPSSSEVSDCRCHHSDRDLPRRYTPTKLQFLSSYGSGRVRGISSFPDGIPIEDRPLLCAESTEQVDGSLTRPASGSTGNDTAGSLNSFEAKRRDRLTLVQQLSSSELGGSLGSARAGADVPLPSKAPTPTAPEPSATTPGTLYLSSETGFDSPRSSKFFSPSGSPTKLA